MNKRRPVINSDDDDDSYDDSVENIKSGSRNVSQSPMSSSQTPKKNVKQTILQAFSSPIKSVIDSDVTLRFVRLAICCESKHKIIKRDIFVKEVVQHPYFRGSMEEYVEAANLILKNTFGLQICTLGVQEGEEQDATSHAVKKNSKAPKEYCVISCLDQKCLMPEDRANQDRTRLVLLFHLLAALYMNNENIKEDDLKELLLEVGIAWDDLNDPARKVTPIDAAVLGVGIHQYLGEFKRMRYIYQLRDKTEEPPTWRYAVGPRSRLEFPPEAIGNIMLTMADIGSIPTKGRGSDVRDRIKHTFRLSRPSEKSP